MYSLTKLTKDVYYFQNIIENPELIINSIDEWKTVVNRDKSFSWDTKSLTDKEINPVLKGIRTVGSLFYLNRWMYNKFISRAV